MKRGQIKRSSRTIVPQRSNPRAMALIPLFKLLARDGTIGLNA
jgi:hypothetical protein